MMIAWLLLTPAAAAVLLVLWFVRSRNLQVWLPAYLRAKLKRTPPVRGPVHLLIAIADHWEPRWNNATYEQETARVDTWYRRYPELARKHRDADGVPLQYTFFYPEEEYRAEHLDKLAELKRMGLADVEVHLHHDHDTAAGLAEKLIRFKRVLHERHGLLDRNEETGQIEYAFIHGNWALDNSDGGRWCGVDDELTVLHATGCYADLTLPAAPEPAQTRKINSIYYAAGRPNRSKSHDTGIDAQAGQPAPPGLLLIQGPLALNWRERKFGVLPRIENGELTADNPPSPHRAALWVRTGVHVQGRPNWVFIKLHAHGANERHSAMLLGQPMEDLLTHLETTYNDGTRYVLHYVTARDMYHIVRAAEAGLEGNPHLYRRFQPAARQGAGAC
ncbi:MAG TPA: hypothetical protein VHA11_12055 [Bryobacteraceae bacterium]|nr:hypothetical protein [Bryobacteraceae bacterium]